MSLEQTIVSGIVKSMGASSLLGLVQTEVESYIQTKTGIPVADQTAILAQVEGGFASLVAAVEAAEKSHAAHAVAAPTLTLPP